MNRPQTVHLSAILTMVASMACLSTQDTFSKLLMLTLTPMIIIWTRYGVQTAMITAIILRKKVAPFIHYPASKTSIAARLLGRGR